MPTYEYACTACAERIEVVQSFTDASLTECPSCAGRLRKVFSPVGVVFKGSGFYKTDSRASTSKSGSKSESKSESKSGAAASADSSGGGGGSTSTSTSTDKPAASAPTSAPAAG